MTRFTYNFSQADAATLHGVDGWVTNAEPVGGVEVFDRTATNIASGTQAIALQTTTVAATGEQRISASVIGLATCEGPTSAIRIGTGGDNATPTYGYGVELLYDTAGARSLKLYRNNGGGFGGTQVSYLASMDAAPKMRTAVVPPSVSSSDLDIIQGLRLVLRETDAGVLLRGYLNELNDDKPDLEFLDRRDWQTPAGSFGDWYLYFGAAPVARTLCVTYFEAEDLDISIERTLRRDCLTLAQIDAAVRLRYDGSVSSNGLNPDMILAFANSTQREIVIELGDGAWFMEPTETLPLTLLDDGRSALPEFVERVVDVFSGSGRATFQHAGLSQSGRLTIRLDTGITLGPIQYRLKLVDMATPTDQTVIPNDHQEALFNGICHKISLTDANDNRQERFAGQFEYGMALLRAEAGRHRRTPGRRFHSPRAGRSSIARLGPNEVW